MTNENYQVHRELPGDVLSGTGLREEGVEGVVSPTNGLVGRHLVSKLHFLFVTDEPAKYARVFVHDFFSERFKLKVFHIFRSKIHLADTEIDFSTNCSID
jgi:hypothetical protein